MKYKESNSHTNNFLYRSARCVIRPLLDVLGHLESHGKENIPEQGGVLLVSNHVSFLDPVIIGAAADRELHFLGEDSYFRIPYVGSLFTQLNGIPIKRETPGWQSLKEVISRLRIGKAIVIFPEGTRSADGILGEVKKGISFIIHHSDVPTIPVLLKGSERFMPRGSKFIHPAQLSVTFGPPIDFAALEGIHQRQALYGQMGEQIKQAILNLG